MGKSNFPPFFYYKKMDDLIELGLIVKPQGIRGEIKIRVFSDDFSRYSNLKKVYINGEEYKINGIKFGADFLFVSLFGVEDRNQAESFRNKYIYVKKSELPPVKEGIYYVADIIGCKVITENGNEIGIVKDVTSSRTDIFTLQCENGKIMRFPFLKDLLIKADVDLKTITVKEDRLKEVACYED